ncbi:MAG: helix-turn-helix transcriptional regulator [Lentisphaerae bacterium]|nr:helix-turn-helix transcriptional regulator [Lentisphaerota bacterium]
MQKVWESTQFKEVYHVNPTHYEPGTPSLRIQSFCHSFSYKSWSGGSEIPRSSMIVSMLLDGKQKVTRLNGTETVESSGYFTILDLSAPGQKFETVSDSAERYFVLYETNSVLKTLLKEMFPAGLPSFYAVDTEKLKICFEAIRDELSRQNADDSRIGGYAYQLLHEAMVQFPEDPLPQPLVLAKNFINNHFRDVHLMTREQIAKAACVSISTLSNLFRTHLNTTIWQTICDKRMENVKQLLTYSNHSIEEIAHECGFTYAYYLAREFKKQFGITPLEYRKRSRLQ